MIMGLPSKQDIVLGLFFNSPKHWHFEELLKKSKLSRSRLNHWLKSFQNGGIIRRVKERGKMPYYVGDFASPSYRSRKRLFALEKMYSAGFLDHLQSLSRAKTVVLFGSMIRSDWYKDSDIDVFVLGDASELDVRKFETRLNHEIQIFEFRNVRELGRLRPELRRNMLHGYFIKGTLDFALVKSDA